MNISFTIIGISIALLISTAQCESERRFLPDVPYGDHEQQVLDIYVPANDSIRLTKVIILIHGGAWNAGRKEDLNPHIPIIQEAFPDYVIANMNYQLGSAESPGFPKQLEDIEAAISFLKSSFTTDLSFVLFGNSAGAHLSLLYAYSWDRERKDVKVVVDHVGPVDFVDDSYCRNLLYRPLIVALLGPYNCQDNPERWNETSPIIYATPEAPPTIGFYGNLDILVPNPQMTLIQAKLEMLGVPSEFTRYPGGHGDWAGEHQEDMWAKIIAFIKEHM